MEIKEKGKSFIRKAVKKNQVIIAALAVMIIIAGYLNLTSQTDSEILSELTESTVDSDLSKNDETGSSLTEFNGTNQTDADSTVESSSGSLDISDEDIYTVADTDSVLDGTQGTSSDSLTGETSGETETSSSDGLEGVSTENTTIVSDSLDEGDVEIGEAIMAGTVLGSGFFDSAKLNREQIRAAGKETLEGIINDSTAGDEAKAEAVNALLEMTNAAALEDELETLLEAKGFETVCYIDGDCVDVVVEAAEIYDADIAKIEDVIMRKTGTAAGNIVISNVVTQE